MKTAVITGASSGLGREFVRQLHQAFPEIQRVWLIARRAERLQELAEQLEAQGLGMGGMKGTCGAVSGAVLLAGMKNSTGNTEHPDSKGATYKLSREIVKEFQEKNSSVVCEELKGVETGNVLRSCGGCIKDAVLLAGKILYGEEE